MDEVVKFWFGLDKATHFQKDLEFDKTVKAKFGDMVIKARNGEYDDIINTPENALGVIILLDQFTRNIYRDSPEAFAADHKALVIAKQSVAAGFDEDLGDYQKMFVYLPFMHSENIADQDECIALNAKNGMSTEFAEKHKVIIARFGRFPHRNKILGRETTPEEAEFLTQPGSSF